MQHTVAQLCEVFFYISEDLLDKLGLGDNIFIVHHKKCYVWQIKGGERRKNARKHFFFLGAARGIIFYFFCSLSLSRVCETISSGEKLLLLLFLRSKRKGKKGRHLLSECTEWASLLPLQRQRIKGGFAVSNFPMQAWERMECTLRQKVFSSSSLQFGELS